MKDRILFLGGASSQVVAIECAREKGIYSIVCDYDASAPGAEVCDKFYNVSTLDFESLLSVAQTEHVNGVVAYATDRAALTAAKLADRLNLPGNPPSAVETFTNKQLFRGFLKRNNFNVPKVWETDSEKDLQIDESYYPLIVKPVDSAGSRGVTTVHDSKELSLAIDLALKFSPSGKCIVEEFIERNHPNVIEVELFALNGKIVTWGLMDCIRDFQTNPLVPAAYRSPITIDAERVAIVKQEITRLVQLSGIMNSAFNVELIFDKKGRLFFLDIGPRSGGNMLPEFIEKISGVNMVDATLDVALGHTVNKAKMMFDGFGENDWGLIALHAKTDGVFEGVCYSREIEPLIVDEYIYKEKGEKVRSFTAGDDVLGLTFLRFESKSQADRMMDNMDDYVSIEVLQ